MTSEIIRRLEESYAKEKAYQAVVAAVIETLGPKQDALLNSRK
jgi:hypothetical protein